MSEKDSLPEADGIKEKKSSKSDVKKKTASKVETPKEDAVVTTQVEVIEVEEEKNPETDNNSSETPTIQNAVETDSSTETAVIAKSKLKNKGDSKSNIKISDSEELDDIPNVDSDEALVEIESSNAKDAEDDDVNDTETKNESLEEKNYSEMSMEALVEDLEKLLESGKIQRIKDHVENIKTEFNSKFSSVLEEKKQEFLDSGGNSIDFHFDFPLKKQFNALYKSFREKRQSHYKNLQQSFVTNLENRQEIIKEIKGLLNVEENINTTYKHFKALQERWRNAGPIPRDKYNNVWNNYHHHVENFYDFLHLNRDLRDLDFKHNLEQKLKIIERAEELAKDDDSMRAFRELQALHKMWKEELGPVAKEHRDEIWGRFRNATKEIHDKRQTFYEKLDEVYVENLQKKNEIIAQIESIAESASHNHSAWQKKIKTIEELRKQFFNAGKVPIKVNEATWAKFKDAVRTFNRNKNAFYKELKKEQFTNLQKKLDLIKIAEEHKDSSDTEVTTPLMKKIQSDWKKIGHVPRKDSDKIWNQFKSACNHYFNTLHEKKNTESSEEVEAYETKSKLLDKIKSLKFTDDLTANLELIKSYIEEWRNLGNVPRSKRYIEGKFNKTIDALFNKLDLNHDEVEMLKYENKLESLHLADDKRLLDNEHNFIRKRIDDIEAEINQLENNLQFFSNVDENNPLVKEVYTKIENQKSTCETWRAKLQKIKQYY